MRQYRIHQIIRTNEIHDEINRLGWAEAERKYPEVRAQQETSHRGAEKWQPEFWTHYQNVALASADDLESLFEISNLGSMARAAGTIRPRMKMHSLSVGDIVEQLDPVHPLDAGKFFMVDRYGFTEININQERAA